MSRIFYSDILEDMELYAGAALTGMGYLLNQQRDMLKTQGTGPVHPLEKPSMKNVYASDHWRTVRADEFARSTANYEKAAAPFQTGYVAKPTYASQFATAIDADANGAVVSSLSGESIPKEQFTHNNMQPFFRGSVKQNMDPFANASRLEAYTGRGELLTSKQEVGSFFEPTMGLTNVCGMQDSSDYYRSHIQTPVVRNNEFPIEQIRVGPGLNQGYTADPSGGFQQADSLLYVQPKTVDELRPLSKPKVVYEGRVQGPSKGVDQRGMVGDFAKNRPDTFYEQSPDQWIRTTGAQSKEMARGIFDVKPTARVDSHIGYVGQANAVSSQPGKGEDDDYGKSAVMVYDNERMTTQTKTVVANATSLIKAIVAPFTDILKHTAKDYTLDAARTFGSMQAQIPSKPTLYDPVNHMMRTTIKETTIHDTTILNLTGPEAGRAENPLPTKPTVRETLSVDDAVVNTVRNIASHRYNVVVYNPDAVARTTHRELTECNNNEVGNASMVDKVGAYTHITVQAPNTQKQFVSDHEHIGTMAGGQSDFRPMSEEADRNAQIDGTREALNIAAGHTPNGAGSFTSLNPELVDMESKKLVSDSIAPRNAMNIGRIIQSTQRPMEACELTKGVGPKENATADRLDPAMLNSLRSNPFNLNVNPIGA